MVACYLRAIAGLSDLRTILPKKKILSGALSKTVTVDFAAMA
jgi:hypothetical protein